MLALARGYTTAFSVTYFSQSLTRRALLNPYYVHDSPRLREYVFLDPLSAVSQIAARYLRTPQLFHALAYHLALPSWIKQQVVAADVIVLEQPWLISFAESMRRGESLLIYNAQNIELAMFAKARIRGGRFVRDRLYREIAALEFEAINKSDLTFVTSEDDRAQMISQYGASQDKLIVVPNGTPINDDVQTEQARKAARTAAGFDGLHIIAFVGAYHLPNIEAVEAILTWARQCEGSDLHFVIIGSVRKAFPNTKVPNVTFTGFVDNVASYLRISDVAINPITSGGGTNLKLLEYLAMRVPTITTAFGARGTGIVHERHAIVCEKNEMRSSVDRLRADPELTAFLRANGRALAEEHFDWKLISKRATEAICHALAEKSKRGAAS